MVQYFLDGGPFMYPILGLLIFGLGFGIERIYTLFKASINTSDFMEEIKVALKEGGTEKAMEVCSNTNGPVAEIFHAGLSRSHRGIETVEKSIENAGTIEMAFLEKNMVWLSTVAVSYTHLTLPTKRIV